MKKLLKITLVLAAVAVLFSSCKSHEKCPAYGNAGKTHHPRATG